MDEGTRGLETLGNEIVVLRGELDVLLAELDRRRHEALDLRLQLRRHGRGAALTGVAFLTTAAGVVGLGLWRRRRQDRLGAQAGRLRRAVSRMIAQPERVAAEPTIVGKIAAAAGSAAAASLVRKLLERGVERYLARPRSAVEASRPQIDASEVERIGKAA